jgi:hypothetical protein
MQQEVVMNFLRTMTVFAALAVASGVAFADERKDESGKSKAQRSRDSGERSKADRQDRSYFHQHGYAQLDIPKGHYPPPGECRIWYPDRPPGHQPPPFKCGAPVPEGAWLIQHPAALVDRVHITVYEPQRPGIVLAVGEFQIGSGALIRVIFSK